MGEGTTRYVIDYYYDNSKHEEDAVPDKWKEYTKKNYAYFENK